MALRGWLGAVSTCGTRNFFNGSLKITAAECPHCTMRVPPRSTP